MTLIDILTGLVIVLMLAGTAVQAIPHDWFAGERK